MDAKSPACYLSEVKIPTFSLMPCCHITIGLCFLECASSQDVFFGTRQFEVDSNLGVITVSIKE